MSQEVLEEEVIPHMELDFTLDDVSVRAGPTRPIPYTVGGFQAFWEDLIDGRDTLTPQEAINFKLDIVEHMNLFLAVSLSQRKNSTCYYIYQATSQVVSKNEWVPITETCLKSYFKPYVFTYSIEPDEEGPKRRRKKTQVKISALETWTLSTKRRAIQDFVMNPQLPPGFNGSTWNDYKGHNTDITQLNVPEHVAFEKLSAILYHIKFVLCRETEFIFEWILDFMSHVLKFPWIKIQVVPIFQGAQGCGKSLVWEHFVKIFGPHGTVYAENNLLTHKFNGPNTRYITFAVANEIEYGANNISKGDLKNMITRTTMKVEPKGGNIFEAIDYQSMVWTTNNETPFPVETGMNRRYFLISSRDHKVGDTEYFKKLTSSLDNQGLKALYDFLMERNVEKDDPKLRNAPLTEEKTKVISNQLSTFDRFWRNRLSRGSTIPSVALNDPGIDPDAARILKRWKIKNVSKQLIYEDFYNELYKREQEHWTIEKFMSCLKDALPHSENLRFEEDGEVINLPPLRECQEYFFKKTGVPCGLEAKDVITQKKRKLDDTAEKNQQLDIRRFIRQRNE